MLAVRSRLTPFPSSLSPPSLLSLQHTHIYAQKSIHALGCFQASTYDIVAIFIFVHAGADKVNSRYSRHNRPDWNGQGRILGMFVWCSCLWPVTMSNEYSSLRASVRVHPSMCMYASWIFFLVFRNITFYLRLSLTLLSVSHSSLFAKTMANCGVTCVLVGDLLPIKWYAAQQFLWSLIDRPTCLCLFAHAHSALSDLNTAVKLISSVDESWGKVTLSSSRGLRNSMHLICWLSLFWSYCWRHFESRGDAQICAHMNILCT